MPDQSHLVILVHGINTRALWMSEIKPALENAGFAVGQTSFGRFSVLRFLLPLRGTRQKAIDRVVTDIRTARETHKIATGGYPDKMSVISHSFGTYVISKILLDVPDLEWERIVFCGSVVREDFPLHQVLKRFRHPLLNEVGSRDFLPALAESAGWGYGSVGSTGFNRPPVETRWHRSFRHSDFLTDKFCLEYWVPFLRGEKPKPADKALAMPLWIRIITLLPLRWIILALVSMAVVALGAVGADRLGYDWASLPTRWGQKPPAKNASAEPADKPAREQAKDATTPLVPSIGRLAFLEGNWIFVNPESKGATISIQKSNSGDYDARSDRLGRFTITGQSDQISGETFKLSAEGRACYYYGIATDNDTMTWTLKRAFGECLSDAILKRAVYTSDPLAFLVGKWVFQNPDVHGLTISIELSPSGSYYGGSDRLGTVSIRVPSDQAAGETFTMLSGSRVAFECHYYGASIDNTTMLWILKKASNGICPPTSTLKRTS
jgi:serine aminopeptidase S33 family